MIRPKEFGPWWILALGVACTSVVRADDHRDLPPSQSVRPELYATGFEFAEGPALDRAGNLYVVNYRRNGTIGRIAPDGTARVFCDLGKLSPVPGKKPQANGLKVDGLGRLVAADAGAGRLLRVAGDGKSIEVLADSFEGKPFDALNDVALDPAGNVYFSDPGASSAERPTGSIYRYDALTRKVARLDTGLAYPNGLAVSPDRQYLCVAESGRFRVNLYDLAPNGTVGKRRVLIDLPAQSQTPGGGRPLPDGMVFDAAGRLYVATWTGGSIAVVEVPSGQLLRQYDAGGSQATNCHFHQGWLYTTVASKEAVFRIKLGVQGFDYNGPGPSSSRTR
jgi:sugar lactone lactonase YvrE